MTPHEHYPIKKKKLRNKKLKVLGIIILILAIAYFVFSTTSDKSPLEYFKDKINTLGQEDQQTFQSGENILINQCRAAFNECKLIGQKKYGHSYSLIEIEVITLPSDAIEFYRTWSLNLIQDPMLIASLIPQVDVYPIVMMATRVKTSGGQIPIVAFCDYQGNMFMESKQVLSC